MNPKNNLTQPEFKRLDEFLISDETSETCMDISMLDGFLTAIAIGPETIMPSRWIPIIFDGEEMTWESEDQAQEIMGLIMRHYNSIISSFTVRNGCFEPIFNYDGDTELVEWWCEGFMCGVELSVKAWRPLFDCEENAFILVPILNFGTEDGRDNLLNNSKLKQIPKDEWGDQIGESVIKIHNYWMPYRKAENQILHKTIQSKIGRNDPCYCDSGKKYKKCCGALQLN